jgi:hypothetical protein
VAGPLKRQDNDPDGCRISAPFVTLASLVSFITKALARPTVEKVAQLGSPVVARTRYLVFLIALKSG